jgi:hypothetical protein
MRYILAYFALMRPQRPVADLGRPGRRIPARPGRRVRRLEEQAEKLRSETDDPLDRIAEGALKLEQAKAKCARTFGNKLPESVASKLALAASKLAEARTAIAAGAERPREAVRLAQEVCALARAAEVAGP